MKYISISVFLIFLLYVNSLCLAQETYHNEEFGFTITIPSQWHISFEDEWSEEVKSVLGMRYFSKILFMLNPSDIKAPDAPCIMVFGREIEGMTTSEAITFIKQTGGKNAVASVGDLAEELLGKKMEQYRKIDTYYHYDSSKNRALARILYKHNDEENVYFMTALAKFIGLQRDVDFRAYWKGKDTEKFKAIYDSVLDSFEFDPDAKPKEMLEAIPQEIKETANLSTEKKIDRILKWGSTILGILIIIGVVKALLDR